MVFGPGSLFYEGYGDRRGFLLAPVTGMLQLMYPAVGRGVEQHSDFYNEPLQRIWRSVPQIQGMILDGPNALATAQHVRDYHVTIKGSMPDGSRYHALDPETFFWTHATFLDTSYRANHFFYPNDLTPAQKEAVYAEGIEWWKMYGLSMRVVPPTYGDFLDYWNHTIDNVLEATPAATRLAEIIRRPGEMPQPWLPKPVWNLLASGVGIGYREVLIGTFPPQLRETFGFTWTRRNEVQFEAFRRAVMTIWPRLPYRVRIMPRARQAYRRYGRIGREEALARVERASGAQASA